MRVPAAETLYARAGYRLPFARTYLGCSATAMIRRGGERQDPRGGRTAAAATLSRGTASRGTAPPRE